ncbi:bifunctional serine/threonine-protein kinase/glutamate ABC transporter substrate-binding protein [Streptomyces sp. NPDC059679]|uniref:bifunctional serine/threonine-protein kinase/glutamate ABC transporter substrate-binding protein n=1 Tax=Streptomyces sp. NPDC059679 TaxID=3346903 RepID=UPI0036BF7DC9
MGLVWRAHDLALHREVALKEVRPPDPGLAEYDPEAARALRARVLREARALARIGHPNVVTIHHIVDGDEHTYPWLVMELIAGGSLQGRLDRGLLSPADAARLGRGMLAGLEAAHAAGIQHRDIKPANILLRPDGSPVLTDFGIAAVQGSTALTAAGSVIGTPDYMAPERVSGEDGGPEADLWSLAMTLYVTVEGRNPMRRGNTLATLAAVLGEDVPPPEHAGALTAVLMSVLVRDPQERPDARTLDRLLTEAEAAAESAPAAGPVAAAESAAASGQAPAAGAAAAKAPADGPTSYPLAPPHTAAPQPSRPVPQQGEPPVYVSPPPPPMPQAPPVHPPAPPPVAPPRRGWVYGSALGAVVLAGALLWVLLPSGDGSDGDNASRAPDTSGSPGKASADTPSNGASDGPSSGKKITIGIKTDQPGIGFKTPDGRYTGFDVDVATYIAKALGHNPADIEWKQTRSSEREAMLERGDVDFVVASYAMTDARKKRIDFAGPYLEAHQDVLIGRDNTSVGTAQDLNGRKVCAVTGSVSALNVRTKFAPQAQVRERDTYALCLSDLRDGAVDAITGDDAILAGYAAAQPNGFKLGGLAMTEERYGIGIRKGSPLKDKIQRALDKMTDDGSWNRALSKNLPLLQTDAPTR